MLATTINYNIGATNTKVKLQKTLRRRPCRRLKLVDISDDASKTVLLLNVSNSAFSNILVRHQEARQGLTHSVKTSLDCLKYFRVNASIISTSCYWIQSRSRLITTLS